MTMPINFQSNATIQPRYTPETLPEPTGFERKAADELLRRSGIGFPHETIQLFAYAVALGRYCSLATMPAWGQDAIPDDIMGELIILGTDQSTGDTRAYVRCLPEQIKNVRHAPMYKTVVVIEKSELDALRQAVVRAKHDEEIRLKLASYEARLHRINTWFESIPSEILEHIRP